MHLTIALGGAGYITAYAIVCVAAPLFLRRIGELTPGVAVTAFVCAGALACALVAFFVVDAASGSPALWMVLALTGALLALVILRLRRARPVRIGSYDEPTAAHVLGGVARGAGESS
jgi:Flp pilus assembly protein TadB